MSGSANNGYFCAGMADNLIAMNNSMRFGGDTNNANGAKPQVSAFSPIMLASGPFAVVVPLTGFTLTIPDGLAQYILNPAGTLATGTITMPANPVEGHSLSICSTQTQTALTLSANTGQSFAVAAPTALVAKQSVRFRYSQGVWYQVG